MYYNLKKILLSTQKKITLIKITKVDLYINMAKMIKFTSMGYKILIDLNKILSILVFFSFTKLELDILLKWNKCRIT